MKIYEIGTGYTPIPARMGAATEIVVEELTRAFLKQEKQVQIIDIAADDRAETDLPILEVPVPKCFRRTDVQLGLMHKLKRVIYSVCLAGVLRNLLKKEEGKVVLHFHNQYNLFFFLKLTSPKLRQKAVIAYTNHSGVWRQEWSKIEGTIQKRYFQEAECMRRADIVFLLNEDTRRNVMAHLGVAEEQIVLIENGANTDIYHPLSPEEKQTAKVKWNVAGCKVILQVGSVYENKGQLRIAEQLLPLLKEDTNLVYMYAGGIVDEAYQQSILQLAKDNGLEDQIRYLGMLSPGKELNEIYNAADATICASRYEGFSLALIESLACGIPVLVDAESPFSLGGGCVAYDMDNLCEVVRQIDAKEAYDRCSRTARQNVQDYYSWDKIASDYYSEFLNRMNQNG